ncbi:hypothetical protein D3Z50_06230 [Clostridiaceae bacterium]|nr:hypothetical protein [Clostridium sp.]NBI70659.1 hypothetical protein [Clostridiaceae bacterium]
MKLTNDKTIQRVIQRIYRDMFCDFHEQYIVVFLCGGASRKGALSLRDRVRPLLENSRKYHYQMPIKVFYPEDLLIEEMNRVRNADLLTYEQLLADNSHIIAIICESAGSLVELGAFTNNAVTVDKVIAAVDKSVEKHKSFIMLGPIKYLKKRGPANVLSYGKDAKEFAAALTKMIRAKYKASRNRGDLEINTIVGMHYYIQLLLYFFKDLSLLQLREMIDFTAKENGIAFTNFRVVFDAALRLLLQERYVMKAFLDGTDKYRLSKSGFLNIEKILRNCRHGYSCDIIRIEIMYSKYYKASGA